MTIPSSHQITPIAVTTGETPTPQQNAFSPAPLLVDRVTGALFVSPATNESTVAATFLQGVKTVAATATPERLVAASTLVDSVEIMARKARGTANTGDVWFGPQSANDAQLRRLTPGDSVTLSAPPGKKIDLYDIFIDVATAGDGVIYTALS
jgi:hypothetical protein